MSVMHPDPSDVTVSLTSSAPLTVFATLFGIHGQVVLSSTLSAALGSTHPECRCELHLHSSHAPDVTSFRQYLEWSCTRHVDCLWFRGHLSAVDEGDVRVLTLAGTHGGVRSEGTRDLATFVRWIVRVVSHDAESS
jgi:hypothetical protein